MLQLTRTLLISRTGYTYSRLSSSHLVLHKQRNSMHQQANKPPSLLQQHAVDIFEGAVRSVLPKAMVTRALQVDDGKLLVDGRTYPLHKNVHIVAFGKAVIGMVRTVEDILGDHVVGGIASVPAGIQENLKQLGKWDMIPSENSRILLLEGASNNMPDSAAHRAAMGIYNYVGKLTESDLLLTLISGGGSALLPAPVPPITLEEMVQLTSILSKGGATIQQLNTVRKQLELLKGGGLAMAADPAKVLSLILSDVIGDPLDFIASGPTVHDVNSGQQCIDLFHILKVVPDIPKSVMDFLKHPKAAMPKHACDNAHNVIVGNNKIAVDTASERAQNLGYVPFVLSLDLAGEARETGKLLVKLANFLCVSIGGDSLARASGVSATEEELKLVHSGVRKDDINRLRRSLRQSVNSGRPLCVIAAGETVVNVRGGGKGGRNQELVLAAAASMQETLPGNFKERFEIQLLSAGTDGQDGPTEAAGAVADPQLIMMAAEQGLNPQDYLDRNDSFTFFSKVNDGRNLVMTGLTGTNVMDIQLLLIKPVKSHL